MKKLVVIIIAGLLFVACQNKDESKPQYQFPSGGGPAGGVTQPAPLQGQEEMKLLKEAVSKDPKNAEAWIRLGNISMDTRQFPDAIEAYTKALKLDPKNVDVRVDLGTCYRNSGKPDVAAREYRKALDLNPNHLNAHKNLGVVLAYDLKDKAQAIREFEKALELAPNAPDAPQLRQEIQNLKASK
ncbi:MAG: tetratricopeptide repeat protein [Nitrospiraceae bacterium]|nr:tetratricopeptide repeat protein [Nitrospiraceae bacterium]